MINQDRIYKEFTVEGDALLLPFLEQVLVGMSRTSVKSFLTHRSVHINNTISTKHNARLTAGDRVTITRGRSAAAFSHPMMQLIFEDDHIIVVEKRCGLLSMGTDREREKTAYYILSQHVKKSDPANLIFIVHRLDRETSGLMVFAKSEAVQEIMQRNWSTMAIERRYVAVVEGHLSKDEGTISARLTENKGYKMFVSNSNQGEMATTKYRVIRKNSTHSLVECELLTGKKNQIRAHFEYVGNPISGDKKYGSQSSPAGRVCLHAHKLHIQHPVTGETMEFNSRVPASFESILSSF